MEKNQILIFSWETFMHCVCTEGRVFLCHRCNDTTFIGATNTTSHMGCSCLVHKPSVQPSLHVLPPRWAQGTCGWHLLHTNSCCQGHPCRLLMFTSFQWWSFMCFCYSEIFRLFAFWNLPWRIDGSSHIACVLSRCDQNLESLFHVKFKNCNLRIFF